MDVDETPTSLPSPCERSQLAVTGTLGAADTPCFTFWSAQSRIFCRGIRMFILLPTTRRHTETPAAFSRCPPSSASPHTPNVQHISTGCKSKAAPAGARGRARTHFSIRCELRGRQRPQPVTQCGRFPAPAPSLPPSLPSLQPPPRRAVPAPPAPASPRPRPPPPAAPRPAPRRPAACRQPAPLPGAPQHRPAPRGRGAGRRLYTKALFRKDAVPIELQGCRRRGTAHRAPEAPAGRAGGGSVLHCPIAPGGRKLCGYPGQRGWRY